MDKTSLSYCDNKRLNFCFKVYPPIILLYVNYFIKVLFFKIIEKQVVCYIILVFLNDYIRWMMNNRN